MFSIGPERLPVVLDVAEVRRDVVEKDPSQGIAVVQGARIRLSTLYCLAMSYRLPGMSGSGTIGYICHPVLSFQK